MGGSRIWVGGLMRILQVQEKWGKAMQIFLLCKSLKCASERFFFLKVLWSCKEEKDMPTIRNKEAI